MSGIQENQIKVSLIIPVYNTEKYLAECLDSVINQTLKETEIICVDDGSADNSLKILKEYAQKDKRIKIISFSENKGLSSARNAALKIAGGEYIRFVDSDDYMPVDAIEKMYKKVKELNLDMLFLATTCFYEETGEFNKEPYFNFKGFPKDWNMEVFSFREISAFLQSLCVAPFSYMIRSRLLKDNNIKFPENIYFEDEPFFIQTVLKADRISTLKDNSYFYRIHRGQITQNREKYFSDLLKAMSGVLDYLSEMKTDPDIISRYKKTYMEQVLSLYCRFSHDGQEKFRREKYEFMKKYIFKGRIFFKERFPDGGRIIYLLGRKVFSYTKKR